MDDTQNSGSDEITDFTGGEGVDNDGKDDVKDELGEGMYGEYVSRQEGEEDAVLEEADEEEVFNTAHARNKPWPISEVDEEEEYYMYGYSELENGGHGSLPP